MGKSIQNIAVVTLLGLDLAKNGFPASTPRAREGFASRKHRKPTHLLL